MFGESNLGDTGHQGQSAGDADGRRRRGLRLQRRVQGHDRRARSRSSGLFTLDDVRKHTKASVIVRLVHRPGRADPRMATAGGDYSATPKQKRSRVRLHRPHAPGGARRDPRAPAAVDSRRDGASSSGARRTAAPRCRPALNYYLISTWPQGSEGRSAVALHQRARARQHPEGRHVLGGAAHVGRRDHVRPSCAASPTSSTSTTIPTVKVTGGQRIDLLGVKKEDLPGSVAATSACRRATRTPRRCAR